MFFGQTPIEWIVFFMVYGGASAVAIVGSIYLLLRRGNAFDADITPPMTLRRWAAAFFAVMFLSHVWWFLFYNYCNDNTSVYCWLVAVPDTTLLLTTIAGTLLSMLQDRKRPAWPVAVGAIPYAVLLALHIAYPGGYFIDLAVAYILLFYVAFTIYVEFAVRQYGRWLRDNYADLEHKEVWVSHVLIIVILILIISDGFGASNMVVSYILQIIQFPLFVFMLWRIETLPQLDNTPPARPQQPLTLPTNIEELLKEHCIDTQLFLQHDLTLFQLSQAMGINRYYLSQYFSRQGMTYNSYISDLRINYFLKLYRRVIDEHLPLTVHQLAKDSGYRSYSTFSLAFKARMGMSVSAWMREMNE